MSLESYEGFLKDSERSRKRCRIITAGNRDDRNDELRDIGRAIRGGLRKSLIDGNYLKALDCSAKYVWRRVLPKMMSSSVFV